MEDNLYSKQKAFIRKEMTDLSFKKCLVLMGLAIERTIPNYEAFAIKENLANMNISRKILDRIWEIVFTEGEVSEEYLIQTKKDHESIANIYPDIDLFDTELVSYAAHSCTIIIHTLEFLLDKNHSHLETVLLEAIETIYQFTESARPSLFPDEEFEKKQEKHPFILREISIQNKYFSLLRTISDNELDEVVIKNMRDLQFNNGRSNIDLI